MNDTTKKDDTREIDPTHPGYEKKEVPEVKETSSNRHSGGGYKNGTEGDDDGKIGI